ncbi:hypothetical protein N657DRAFT_262391 [Parathielavia appendiculata]|uniref:Uncharacterized protein n=1 Tax=Parathielavia appendiculata TaxID=2587402 RepID=A0AAN6TRX5_9PEZI|nr:hypothetical protein N657DRAFT_262391 [Parathielavia appendiculata]
MKERKESAERPESQPSLSSGSKRPSGGKTDRSQGQKKGVVGTKFKEGEGGAPGMSPTPSALHHGQSNHQSAKNGQNEETKKFRCTEASPTCSARHNQEYNTRPQEIEMEQGEQAGRAQGCSARRRSGSGVAGRECCAWIKSVRRRRRPNAANSRFPCLVLAHPAVQTSVE